jgi:hypothetical protein
LTDTVEKLATSDMRAIFDSTFSWINISPYVRFFIDIAQRSPSKSFFNSIDPSETWAAPDFRSAKLRSVFLRWTVISSPRLDGLTPMLGRGQESWGVFHPSLANAGLLILRSSAAPAVFTVESQCFKTR